VKRVLAIIVSIVIPGILIILALPPKPAEAQEDQAVLRFAPPVLSLIPDQQGTVQLLIEDVQGLYGLELQLAFDPDVVQVADADPNALGVQIQPSDCWEDGFVAVNRVENGSGRIDFAATRLRPARAISGDLEILTITLDARISGTGALNVKSAILSTREAEEIPYRKQAGKIVVDANVLEEAPANNRSAGLAPGRLTLAGAAILSFLIALGVFLYALGRH
jgi:hypothetical protein